MPKALSVDLRSRVIQAIEGGLSRRQAAARFGVGVSSAIRWYAEFKASGRLASRPQGGDRRSGAIEAHADFLLEQVRQTPDLTLAQWQEALAARGLRISDSAIDRFFKRRGITYKKRQRGPASMPAPT